MSAHDETPIHTPPHDRPSPTSDRMSLATASLLLGIAGVLPILPVVGSVGALVCGYLAMGDPTIAHRDRARAGVVLGWLGLMAPVLALFVYCVVLGYPFPIHRYRP